MKDMWLKKHLIPYKSPALTALIAVFIIHLFLPLPFLGTVVNVLTVTAVLICLPFTGRGSGAICLGLFALGAYLIYASGEGLQFMAGAVGKNTSLLVLLITVPLLGISLKYGGYIEVLDALALRYMSNKHRMYWVPALLSHILGVFMNLGAVPLTYEITNRGRVLKYPGLLSRSISRGFSAALLWSPNMIATALTLAYLKVSWQDYVYTGIVIAAVSVLMGYIVNLFEREGRSGEEQPVSGVDQPYLDRLKLAQMTFAAAVFLLIILLIETKTQLSVIGTVPVIALLFPALWLFLLGKKENIAEGYTDYIKNKIDRYDGEVVLFAAAGFFSSALTISGWSEKICGFIIHFSAGSKASTALAILGSIVIASLLGIHPMVLVSAFAASLDPATLGFSPVHLALILITGWSLGATVSPMSGTCLVVGSLFGKTPLRVGLDNLPHAALVFTVVILYSTFF